METQYLKHKKTKPAIYVVAFLNTRLKYREYLGGYPVYINIAFLHRNSCVPSKTKLNFKTEQEFDEFFSKDSPTKNLLVEEIEEIRESISNFMETNKNVDFKYNDWSKNYFVSLNRTEHGIDQISVVCTFDVALENQLTKLKIDFYKRKGFKYEKHDSVSLDNNIKKVTIYFTYSKNN